MLGKIFKQEMKATSKLFIPLMIGFVAVTLLCKLAFENSYSSFLDSRLTSIISGLFYTLYFIYIVALMVMTSVFIVTHFYKTMISDQAYLTHTLPVKTSTVINGKLLCAVVWEIISFVLLISSIFVFTLGHLQISSQDIKTFFTVLSRFFEEIQYNKVWLLAIEILILTITSLFSGPLMLYASMALGHLFQKHRVLWSVVAFFAIYILMQVICSSAMVFFTPRFIQNQSYNSFSFDSASYFRYILSSWVPFSVLFSIACTGGFYAITDYIFSKHLNLE